MSKELEEEITKRLSGTVASRSRLSKDRTSKIQSIQWAFWTFITCTIGLATYFAYQFNAAKGTLAQMLGTNAADPQFQALMRMGGDTRNSFGAWMLNFVCLHLWIPAIVALIVGLVARWLTKPSPTTDLWLNKLSCSWPAIVTLRLSCANSARIVRNLEELAGNF